MAETPITESPTESPEIEKEIEKLIEDKEPHVIIETEGRGVNSPYPWRREFKIRVKAKTWGSKIERLCEWRDAFAFALHDNYEVLDFDDLPSLYSYAKSFCKYCALKQNPYSTLCFRHFSIQQAIDLIGDESNHTYRYEFFLFQEPSSDEDEEPTVRPVARLTLGANMWEILVAPNIAIVKRPSGKRFTLRARPNQVTSHLLLARKLLSFIDFVIKFSYYQFETT